MTRKEQWLAMRNHVWKYLRIFMNRRPKASFLNFVTVTSHMEAYIKEHLITFQFSILLQASLLFIKFSSVQERSSVHLR